MQCEGLALPNCPKLAAGRHQGYLAFSYKYSFGFGGGDLHDRLLMDG